MLLLRCLSLLGGAAMSPHTELCIHLSASASRSHTPSISPPLGPSQRSSQLWRQHHRPPAFPHRDGIHDMWEIKISTFVEVSICILHQSVKGKYKKLNSEWTEERWREIDDPVIWRLMWQKVIRNIIKVMSTKIKLIFFFLLLYWSYKAYKEAY